MAKFAMPLGRRNKVLGASSGRGSVTVELVFVAPVLLFLIAMVFTTGRLISQFAWMSQTAFQAYLIGAEFSDPSERTNAMNGRWTKLMAGNMALSAVYNGPRAIDAATFDQPATTGTDMLASRVSGNVISLFGYSAAIPLSVTITGPILAPTAPVTDLANPQNPDVANQRNCVGAQGPMSTGNCTICPNETNCFCLTSGGPAPYSIPCPP